MIIKPRIEVKFPNIGCCIKSTSNAEQTFGRHTWLLDSGHSALYVAFSALHLPAGSRVGVMAYNCHSVADAVAAANLKPIFIDVTKSLRIDVADLKQKAPQLQALVVTHLFGLENNIAELKRQLPTLPIIEDCAHAFGIASCETEADMAIYSVGRGKLPSLTDGGMLVCNNMQHVDSIAFIYQSLPSYTVFQEITLMIKSMAFAIAYTPLVYTLLTRHFSKRKHVSVKHMQSAHKARQMSRTTRQMLHKAMQQLPQQLSQRAQNSLQSQQVVQSIASTNNQFISHDSGNHFMDIYLCDNPERLRAALLKKGIDSATHFEQSIEWNMRHGYTKGSCPTAEWLTHHLLAVPTYISWNKPNRNQSQYSKHPSTANPSPNYQSSINQRT